MTVSFHKFGTIEQVLPTHKNMPTLRRYIGDKGTILKIVNSSLYLDNRGNSYYKKGNRLIGLTVNNNLRLLEGTDSQLISQYGEYLYPLFEQEAAVIVEGNPMGLLLAITYPATP